MEKCKKCGHILNEDDYVFMGYCENCYEKYGENETKEIYENLTNTNSYEEIYDQIEKKKISGNQKIIMQAEISYISFTIWICIIIAMIYIGIVSPIPFGVILVLIIPLICVAIYEYSYTNKMELYYTKKKVVGRIGILTIRTLDTPLNKINTISVDRSFLGFGTIRIASSSGNYNFKYVKNAEELKNGIMEEIENYEQEKIKQQAIEMAKAMQKQ